MANKYKNILPIRLVKQNPLYIECLKKLMMTGIGKGPNNVVKILVSVIMV